MVVQNTIANASSEAEFIELFRQTPGFKESLFKTLKRKFPKMSEDELSAELDYSVFLNIQRSKNRGIDISEIQANYTLLRSWATSHITDELRKRFGRTGKNPGNHPRPLSLFSPDEESMGLIDRLENDEDAPDANMERRENKKEQIGIFRDLTIRERQLVYLRYASGLNSEKIGELYGVYRSTIYRRLSQINNRLRKRAEKLKVSHEDLIGLNNLLRENFLQNPRNWSAFPDFYPGKEELEKQYQGYLAGRKVYNPIQVLTDQSSTIVRQVIEQIISSKTNTPSQALERNGFIGVLRTHKYNMTSLALKTNPESVHKISKIQKWQRGEESVQIALNGIEEILLRRPDYREAQEKNDRELRVRALNKLIEQENLTEFFRDLNPLMSSFIDSNGIYGIKKQKSPKALLKFYDEKRGYNIFDRSQETYVPIWRITERGMWKSKDSITMGVEAIQDCLRELPHFRELEQKDPIAQLRVIDKELLSNNKNKKRFKKRLSGLMTHLIDTSGENGIKKPHSVYETLAFYSRKKALDWMSSYNPAHLEGGEKKHPSVVYSDSDKVNEKMNYTRPKGRGIK